MTGFAIEFLPRVGLPPDRHLALGRLTLGGSIERFSSGLDFWAEADYREQWKVSLGSLLSGEPAGVLLTYVDRNPDEGLVRRWVWYRLGAMVAFQEQLLLPRPDMERTPSDWLRARPRETVSEDGERRVSEWLVPLTAIECFVRGSFPELFRNDLA